jgi:hypothetical protein
MSKNNEEIKPKRSSLKNSERLNPNEIMAYSKKRNSVSWKLNSNLNFDEVKAKFNIKEKKEESEHDKQFKEARRKSIKNEFSLAKELLKNNKEILEIENEEGDDIKENTHRNEHIKNESDSEEEG